MKELITAVREARTRDVPALLSELDRTERRSALAELSPRAPVGLAATPMSACRLVRPFSRKRASWLILGRSAGILRHRW